MRRTVLFKRTELLEPFWNDSSESYQPALAPLKETWSPMTKIVKMAAFALVAMFMLDAGEAFAQDSAELAAASASWGKGIGAGIAAGFAVVGAGIGIGLIGAGACNATARQPEVGGRIFVNMILTAALVEGVALFAVVVGFLMQSN